jgi:hypothetical protein
MIIVRNNLACTLSDLTVVIFDFTQMDLLSNDETMATEGG